MRFSPGELSEAFLDKYDSVPERDRESLTIEVIALAAGINPKELLGEIVLAVREYSVTRYKLKAMDSHTEVLEEQIKFAKTPAGYNDRRDINTILGALPRNKTTFIDKLYMPGSDGPAPGEGEKDDEEVPEPVKAQVEEMVEDEDFVFPDADVMQQDLQPIRQRLLKD